MARETLTREQIIRSAIELLDAEGLDGLNMRALGKRLGAAPTAVYWHVKNKDDLMLLAADEVWDEIELPDPEAAGWRAAATSMATGLHAMFLRHPWMVQAFGFYLLYGEGKSRYDDHSLAVYEAGGLTDAAADRAAAAVFTFALGSATGAAATASLVRRLGRGGRDPEELIGETMARARETAERFPRLRRRLDSPGADYNASPERTFEVGLRALLDGLSPAGSAERLGSS